MEGFISPTQSTLSADEDSAHDDASAKVRHNFIPSNLGTYAQSSVLRLETLEDGRVATLERRPTARHDE